MLTALAPTAGRPELASTRWEGGSCVWGTGEVSTLGHGQREATAFPKHDMPCARQERPLSLGHGPAGHWDADCQARGDGRAGPPEQEGARAWQKGAPAWGPPGPRAPQQRRRERSQRCFAVLVVRKDLDAAAVGPRGQRARVREGQSDGWCSGLHPGPVRWHRGDVNG